MNKSGFDRLQVNAVNTLLDKVFEPITKYMEERYLALARTNSQIYGCPPTFFLYRGEIYPPVLAQNNRQSKMAGLPALHHSLLQEFLEIDQMLEQHDYSKIKNFFSAVISQSAHGIVLNEMLPDILLQTLKTNLLSSEFKILDQGSWNGIPSIPLSVTQQNIQDMKTHYQPVMTQIKHMLMDHLLLAS